MIREGESTIEAICVVRELGTFADDRGAGKVPDLFGALRSANRGAGRRYLARRALKQAEAGDLVSKW